MASTLVNSLYPPLVDTFMPAFSRDASARIHFSISPYNANDSINYIHISLTDMASNQSVLKPTYKSAQEASALTTRTIYSTRAAQDTPPKVLNDILIIPFDKAVEQDDGSYYVELSANMLRETDEGDPFPINKYFKAQLRFDNSIAAGSNLVPENTSYLIDGRKFFSEWSSICLIRAIEKPQFVLTGFDKYAENENFVRSFSQGAIPVTGYLYFPERVKKDGTKERETERLVSYEVFLYDENNEVVSSTGTLYPGGRNKDEIDCLLDGDNTVPGEFYQLVVKGLTQNHYEAEISYTISIADYEGEYTFRPAIKLTEDIEDGKVRIHVTVEDDQALKTVPAPGRLYVRRASSLDNFKKWELLAAIDQAASDTVDEVIIDSTAGSLVSYQYAVQYQFYKGTWSQTTYSNFIYPTFYDILLYREGVQLAIRYNGQMTSLKPVVNRSKFDTLGSKYPKFAQNAQMNYKQYSLSGLISAESDFNRQFISEYDDKYTLDMKNYSKAYGDTYMVRNDSLPKYKDDFINREHDAYPHENWYWERQFREEALNWLNDGKAKLFRSMTEGNMIVMLTDVSLTPNQNIGRMLYNFTATVYEIGDGYSLKELDAAGIIDTPDIFAQELTENKESVRKEVSSLRQIEFVNGIYESTYMTRTDAVQGFYDIINAEYAGTQTNREILEGSLSLSKVSIEFISKPKWLDKDGDAVTIEGEVVNGVPEHYGYAIKINNNDPLMISERGIYAFPEDWVITKLEIMNQDDVLVTGVVSYKENIKTATLPDLVYKEDTVIGQHYGIIECGKWLGNTVRAKYEVEIRNDDGAVVATQKMNNWKNISMEITPYTLVNILFKGEIAPTSILVGRSGTYTLKPLAYVDDICVVGRKMFRYDAPHTQLEPWEFTEGADGKEWRNSVYEKEGQLVIFYNGKEYPFYYEDESKQTGIAKIPVEGYINYLGDIVRSEYI